MNQYEYTYEEPLLDSQDTDKEIFRLKKIADETKIPVVITKGPVNTLRLQFGTISEAAIFHAQSYGNKEGNYPFSLKFMQPKDRDIWSRRALYFLDKTRIEAEQQYDDSNPLKLTICFKCSTDLGLFLLAHKERIIEKALYSGTTFGDAPDCMQ